MGWRDEEETPKKNIAQGLYVVAWLEAWLCLPALRTQPPPPRVGSGGEPRPGPARLDVKCPSRAPYPVTPCRAARLATPADAGLEGPHG